MGIGLAGREGIFPSSGLTSLAFCWVSPKRSGRTLDQSKFSWPNGTLLGWGIAGIEPTSRWVAPASTPFGSSICRTGENTRRRFERAQKSNLSKCQPGKRLSLKWWFSQSKGRTCKGWIQHALRIAVPIRRPISRRRAYPLHLHKEESSPIFLVFQRQWCRIPELQIQSKNLSKGIWSPPIPLCREWSPYLLRPCSKPPAPLRDGKEVPDPHILLSIH